MMKASLHLVLDIGNTQTKYGLFQNNIRTDSGVCSDWNETQWKNFTEKKPISTILIGSVGASTKHLLHYLPKQSRVFFVDHTTQYPFTSKYQDINTLGVDRRAAITGGMTLFPQKPLLVIDAGSCITYDYIDAAAVHHGGAIAPGRAMRYQALHLCTAALPLEKPTHDIPQLGTSTNSSMQYGVEFGVIAEINSQIEHFSEKFGDFTTILTGGDADFLIKKIKNGIFANTDLNLIGLHRLLIFNKLHEK